MFWFLLSAIVVSVIAFVWITWRKSNAPWHQIEKLVRQVSSGERPRTFLVEGGAESKRVGLALEKIFARQEELERQVAGRESDRQTILRAMQDGLLAVDSGRRVTLVNRAFRKLFGLAPISPGTPLLDVLRDATIDGLIAETLRSGQATQRELVFPDSRGERHLEISAVPMRDDADRITAGAVILFHDISQLKQADRVRSDFVANVSHELRTPLSILRGYIETLRDNPTTPPEELSRILEVMERHSMRLGLLVEDLLTLAELESSRPNLQLSEVRLAELFKNVARDWEKKLSDKRLKAVVRLAPDLPSTIRADETRLQEVLYNLLDNAVKYSSENGQIELQAERRETVAGAGDPGKTPPGEIVISVTDNGVGISKEDLPRIFERFYRADKARSRELGGTGLGLAIVKHIAQLHDGRWRP
ncbi:MAG: ATP-binding protein [Verrucomicrobiota bacterium]